MTTPADWQKTNEAYLVAALAGLRLRLERLGSDGLRLPSAVRSLPARKSERSGFFLFRWLRYLFGKSTSNEVSHTAVQAVENSAPVMSDEKISEELAKAEAAMTAAEQNDLPPALTILCQRFALSGFEQQLLLLCIARDLDTRVDKLCARAQHDANRNFPTYALAMVMFEEPLWDALSPDRPLRYWNLIEINQPGSQPLTLSALRADERVVNYVKGLNHLDDRVARWLAPLQAPNADAELPASQQGAIETIRTEIEHAITKKQLPIVQLLGRDAVGKKLVSLQVANEFRRLIYVLNADDLPAQNAELATLIRLLRRETQLLPLSIYVDARDVDKATESRAAALKRFLLDYEGLIFLDAIEPWPCADRRVVSVNIAKPTAYEQYDAWVAQLGESSADLAEQLAGQFSLNLPAINQIADKSQGSRAAIWQTCRSSLRPTMNGLAQHLAPRREWEDLDPQDPAHRQMIWDVLVLPEPDKRLLMQVASQVAHRFKVYETWKVSRSVNRGLGISALFAGESGTGKTLAAEVLAKILDLDLYRIDLSSVVNKYIGETEKNLRRLFDAAEDSGVVLFFDEADALFGKRSEVKDSHDRYANIEINYLLQRLEAYNGLAILATNLKGALDQAFMRRLRFVVNFPFPSLAERLLIWKKAFPPGVPLDANLNYDRLAKLNLTGGNIHSIAINAAFLAASHASAAVPLPTILEAARDELRKLDRQFSEADFRP
ncbi:MAG TPA: AAA family ATPase [Blastocatellia bacterium]|nr:AAA family ATPase [Blastocatellia bacterium]